MLIYMTKSQVSATTWDPPSILRGHLSKNDIAGNEPQITFLEIGQGALSNGLVLEYECDLDSRRKGKS